jgi:hypothetical protein
MKIRFKNPKLAILLFYDIFLEESVYSMNWLTPRRIRYTSSMFITELRKEQSDSFAKLTLLFSLQTGGGFLQQRIAFFTRLKRLLTLDLKVSMT